MSLQKTIDIMYVSLNRVRMQPDTELVFYEQSKRFFNGLIYRDRIRTRQGPNALQHLVTDLKERSPIHKKLKWSFALHMDADEQAIKLGDNGLITTENTRHHVQLPERCKQYGIVRGRLTEVYEFGGNSPQEILETLLVDDGLASRKRRKTLLDPIYNYVGIGTSFHEKYGTVTVIILAEDVISLVSPGDEGNYLRREAHPQGETYTFDVKEERDNERRKVQFKKSRHNRNQDQSRNHNYSTDHYNDSGDRYDSRYDSLQDRSGYPEDNSRDNRHNYSREDHRLDQSRHQERNLRESERHHDLYEQSKHSNSPKHQNALKDHSDHKQEKQKSKCQIF